MFYTTNQNNSGGYFIQNDDVTQFVIVEANNVTDAISKFDDVTCGYSEFCTCCGERWDYDWNLDEEDGTESPMIYGEPVLQIKRQAFRHEAIIYYLDGRKQKIEFK